MLAYIFEMIFKLLYKSTVQPLIMRTLEEPLMKYLIKAFGRKAGFPVQFCKI